MADTDARSVEHLQAVAAADEQLWSQEGTSASINLRNHAAQSALTAGWSVREIAAWVRVKPEDVHRWAGAALSA